MNSCLNKMVTHCYIGIEDKKDHTVRYVYVNYDGYFSHIVPILRRYYLNRKDVESLIHCGHTPSILLPNEWIVAKEESMPIKVNNRYAFELDAKEATACIVNRR